MPRPKPTAETKFAAHCVGGQSYGCKHEEHEKSKQWPDIICYRCHVRMGCGWCVQIPRELLCLRCHDFATAIAMKFHGPVVQSRDRRLAEIGQLAKAAMRD